MPQSLVGSDVGDGLGSAVGLSVGDGLGSAVDGAGVGDAVEGAAVAVVRISTTSSSSASTLESAPTSDFVMPLGPPGVVNSYVQVVPPFLNVIIDGDPLSPLSMLASDSTTTGVSALVSAWPPASDRLPLPPSLSRLRAWLLRTYRRVFV